MPLMATLFSTRIAVAWIYSIIQKIFQKKTTPKLCPTSPIRIFEVELSNSYRPFLNRIAFYNIPVTFIIITHAHISV